MSSYVLSERVASQVMRLIGESDVPDVPAGRGAGGPPAVFVQCTSTVPIGSDPLGSQCYPGLVLAPASDYPLPPEQDPANGVLLSVIDASGVAATPVLNGVYLCVLAGDCPADTGTGADPRPRCFGATAPAGIIGPGTLNHVAVFNSAGTNVQDSFAQATHSSTGGALTIYSVAAPGATDGAASLTTGANSVAGSGRYATLTLAPYGTAASATITALSTGTRIDSLYMATDFGALFTMYSSASLRFPGSVDFYLSGPSGAGVGALNDTRTFVGLLCLNPCTGGGAGPGPPPTGAGWPINRPASGAATISYYGVGGSSSVYVSIPSGTNSLFTIDPMDAGATAAYSVVQSGVQYTGATGTIGPGAACNGGLITNAGSGSFLSDPGDGLAGGTYP